MSFNFGINGTTLMFLHMQKKKKLVLVAALLTCAKFMCWCILIKRFL